MLLCLTSALLKMVLKSLQLGFIEFRLKMKNCEISSQRDFSAWEKLPLSFLAK